MSTLRLFISPTTTEKWPRIDHFVWRVLFALQRRMEGCFEHSIFEPGARKPERQVCTGPGCQAACGAWDYQLSDDSVTHALALHHLLYHRADISQEDLDWIQELELPDHFDYDLLNIWLQRYDPNQRTLHRPVPRAPKKKHQFIRRTPVHHHARVKRSLSF